jgi:hypothetical protein
MTLQHPPLSSRGLLGCLSFAISAIQITVKADYYHISLLCHLDVGIYEEHQSPRQDNA